MQVTALCPQDSSVESSIANIFVQDRNGVDYK